MVSENKCFDLIVVGIVACLALIAVGCQPSTPEGQALNLAEAWADERAKENQERDYNRLKLSGYPVEKKPIELTLDALDIDATAVTSENIRLVVAKADCPNILTAMGIEKKYDNCGTDYLLIDIGEERVSKISSDQAQKLQGISTQEEMVQSVPTATVVPAITEVVPPSPTAIAMPAPTVVPAPTIAPAPGAPPTPLDVAVRMGAQPTATFVPAPTVALPPTAAPASVATTPPAPTAAPPTAIPAPTATIAPAPAATTAPAQSATVQPLPTATVGTVPPAPTATATSAPPTATPTPAPTATATSTPTPIPTPTAIPTPSVPVGNDVGERAPDFKMTLADGSVVTLASLIAAERPTFLFFFATF